MGCWRVVVLIAVLLPVACGQRNSTQSGCEVCASTGECSQAYRGESGQFCGNWLDRQSTRRPCCCPKGAVCRVANYACNCGYAPGGAEDEGYGLLWLWWLLGSLGLLFCCCGCSFMAFKRVQDRAQNGSIPVAAPAVDSEFSRPYGASSSPYANGPVNTGYATATPAYDRYYDQNRGRSGMSAGTGAALGGTAGLLGGLMLGNSLAGNNGGDGGGFGGGDYGGDFGGGGDFAGDF